MAAGVSSPARPSPVYLHDPLSHTNNNSSNFNSASTHHSVSTSSSPSLTSLTRPPPAAPAPHLLLSSPTNQDSLRRPRPSVSPNSTSNISTAATFATPPLSSSPLESVADPVLTRPRPQLLPVNSARGDPRLQKSGGFFASFAASAIDRTQSAIATISDQTVRHQRSLSRLSITGDPAAHNLSAEPSPDRSSRYRPASTLSSASSSNLLSPQLGSKFPSSQALPAQDPPYSRPYSETDPTHPPPILLPRIDNKMHQTSSRLLRMTDDDRPFTKVSPFNLIRFRPPAVVPENSPVISDGAAAVPGGAAARPDLRIRRLTVACRTSRISLQH